MSPIQDLGTFTLAVAAIFGVGFLVAYSVLARWWESATGWYLWVSSAILTIILGYNYAALQGWLSVTQREWTRFLIYFGALVIMVWRGALLLAAQYQVYREAQANLLSKKHHQARTTHVDLEKDVP